MPFHFCGQDLLYLCALIHVGRWAWAHWRAWRDRAVERYGRTRGTYF